MTNPELGTGFDILYNNITSNQAPGLNKTEMNFFLNKAQEEVLKNHLNPKGNKYGEGYDDSPKRQIEFATSTMSVRLTGNSDLHLDFNEMFAIINESVEVVRDGTSINLTVVPISYDEWDRIKSSPYPYPLKRQAWRILNNSEVQFVVQPNDTIRTYTIRYVARPSKIDLNNTIDTCKLPEVLHQEILQRAVELAKLSWEGNINSALAAGQTSE